MCDPAFAKNPHLIPPLFEPVFDPEAQTRREPQSRRPEYKGRR
jgi:hypothetical protein